MRSRLKKIRHWVEWLLVIMAAKIVRLLSRRVCHLLGQMIGAGAAMIDRRGRGIALSNLEAAFGDQLSPARRAQVVQESYQQFVRTMLDLLWSPRLNPKNFREWYEVVNLDEVLADAGPNRSVIFITFHYGNFEWAAHTMGLCGLRGILLAQEFKNPLLEPIFNQLRTHSGNEVAPRQGGLLRMYKALKRGKHVAVLTDLTLKPWDPSVAIDCFGLKKCVTYAHAWLHQRTGAPIVPVHCEPLRDGRYRLEVQPKIEFPKGASIVEITQTCWDRLEPIVRKNPSPWIWMYKHWRYRLAGSAKPYPFYAEVGPAFEARLNRARAELERPAMQ
jgi:KDO2-lipid IV(A) lauroyltransferase